MAIKLGSKVRDRITGFQGTATQRVEMLHGIPRIFIEGRDNGCIREEWFDEARCEELPVKNVSPVAQLQCAKDAQQ